MAEKTVTSGARNNKNGVDSPETLASEVQTIKNIILLLDKTINQRKLFSQKHENVTKFIDMTYGGLKQYLNSHSRLELGIEDFSITFKDKVVFTEEEINKSLPYLFFKDGMKFLYFHNFLTKEEFKEFIEIILENSLLPPEESDIVFSMWEKDFAHISFYATDEFLDTKISARAIPKSYALDITKLTNGSLQLLPEDKSALKQISESQHERETSSPESSSIQAAVEASPHHDFLEDLSQENLDALEQMIEDNRKVEDDDEFITLCVEMLLIEQTPEQFAENLDALKQELNDLIKRGDFARACQVQTAAIDLQTTLSLQGNKNAEQVTQFISDTKDTRAVKSILEAFQNDVVRNMDAFFDYLIQIGQETVPLVRQLFSQQPDATFLMKAPEYFSRIAETHMSTVFQATMEAPPQLVKCVIAAFRKFQDKKTVPYLTHFTRSKNHAIRKEAVHALAEIEDITASKALLPLMNDDDLEMRILAVKSMTFFPDEELLEPFFPLIQEKSFIKKSAEEKRVLLEFLCRYDSPRTDHVFRSFLKKPGLFSRKKKRETSLIAVDILSQSQRPQALELLNEGADSGNKHIRTACRQALKRSTHTETLPHE